jgi:hypothetical protein
MSETYSGVDPIPMRPTAAHAIAHAYAALLMMQKRDWSSASTIMLRVLTHEAGLSPIDVRSVDPHTLISPSLLLASLLLASSRAVRSCSSSSISLAHFSMSAAGDHLLQVRSDQVEKPPAYMGNKREENAQSL